MNEVPGTVTKKLSYTVVSGGGMNNVENLKKKNEDLVKEKMG